MMMKNIFALVSAMLVVGCSEPSVPDMTVPDGGDMMNVDAGMMMQVDSGTVDAGSDAGQVSNVNQCLTNNGGCFPGVLCTDHFDPLPVTCGNCPVGYVGNGMTCMPLKHWVCSANAVNNLPGYTLAACPNGNEYTGGVTDAANALNSVVGDFYVTTSFNDRLSSNNVQVLYRVCSFDSLNEPVSGPGVSIVDCVEVP